MSALQNAATELAARINAEIVLTRPPTTIALAALGGCLAHHLSNLTRHLPAAHAVGVVEAYLALVRRQVAADTAVVATPPLRKTSINWNGA